MTYARIFKFNPNHDHANGRFTNGPGTALTSPAVRGHLSELYTRVAEPDGGFTYSPSTNSEPSSGYALSIYPDRSFAKDAKALTREDLVKYVVKNKDLLSQKENYFGAWHDPASNKVFLDVSMVTQDKQKAHDLALKHDQIAYFDLSTFQSVTVNADATSGGAAK